MCRRALGLQKLAEQKTVSRCDLALPVSRVLACGMDSFLAREREREQAQAQGGQRELLSPEACVEVTKEPRGGPSNIRDGQVCSSRTVPATSLLQDLHLWHSCTGGNAVRAQPPSRQRVLASHLLPLRWAGDFAISVTVTVARTAT